jgi:hypothetical protein
LLTFRQQQSDDLASLISQDQSPAQGQALKRYVLVFIAGNGVSLSRWPGRWMNSVQ